MQKRYERLCKCISTCKNDFIEPKCPFLNAKLTRLDLRIRPLIQKLHNKVLNTTLNAKTTPLDLQIDS